MNRAQFILTISHWVERPWPTLSESERAILENDLRGALARVQSDLSDLEELHGIVSWCYNVLPAECWGSRAKVEAWIASGGLAGRREREKRDAAAG